MSDTAGAWNLAWATALDRLESDVASAEALLTEEHMLRELPKFDPWTPPAGLGPLPLDMRPRADAVLRRQLEVATKLAAAMSGAAMHSLVVGKMVEDRRDPARPSYVDVAM
ncbi:hypothetical protein [Actinokineospora diospyrosa]|uniref:Uncharacterized protein n=1 Tax=Actinokineospora diospyrosa TaxID=103728 RepID=A0ABT1I921_9PSEU|nr:hypothetical protein [Actinokineospora diospyrosa]MCP2269123.1 hypothetical protein [Actinokineospora diospyrosa]